MTSRMSGGKSERISSSFTSGVGSAGSDPVGEIATAAKPPSSAAHSATTADPEIHPTAPVAGPGGVPPLRLGAGQPSEEGSRHAGETQQTENPAAPSIVAGVGEPGPVRCPRRMTAPSRRGTARAGPWGRGLVGAPARERARRRAGAGVAPRTDRTGPAPAARAGPVRNARWRAAARRRRGRGDGRARG